MIFTIKKVHVFSFRYFILLQLLLLVIGCSNKNTEPSAITRKNLYAKIEKALDESMEWGGSSLADDVIFFVESEYIIIGDSLHQGIYNCLLGDKFFNNNQFKLSKSYYESALAILDRPNTNKKYLAYCYNGLAIIESFAYNNLEGFKGYIQKAFENTSEEDEYMSELYYSLANIYISYQDYANSKIAATKGIRSITRKKTKKHLLKYMYMYLARCDIALGNYGTALENLQCAIDASNEHDNHIRTPVYNMYSLIHKEKGQLKEALHYAMLANEKNRLDIRELRMEQDHKMTDWHTLYSQIYEQKEGMLLQGNITIALIIGILCITIAYIFYIIKQKANIKKHSARESELNKKLQRSILETKKNNENLLEKTAQTKSLLAINQRTLYTKELEISTLKDSLVHIGTDISNLLKNEKVPVDKLARIKKRLESLLSGNKDVWQDFKAQFETLRPNFFKNLKKYCPELTVNELKQCSYILSNLSNREVSELTNTSIRSVESARYRIKKKLKLDTGDSLHDFLLKL